MFRIFAFVVILLLNSMPINNCKAQENVPAMDIVNKAPRCYVISEIMSLYIQDNRSMLENYFINYHNASMFVTSDNYNSNTISLIFNEQTVMARKNLMKSLAKVGYQAETYEKTYQSWSCQKYSKLIPPENILLK
jgi:hypothetical protein